MDDDPGAGSGEHGPDPNEETVLLSFDGVSYALDLGVEEAAVLRADLAGWVARSRRVRRRLGTERDQLVAIRVWAHRNGYPILGTGRIPIAVRDAFTAAHQGTGAGPERT